MRLISYVLLIYSLLLFASAAYDQHRGRTVGPTHFHDVLTRQRNPKDFQNAMTCNWFFASLMMLAGTIAYAIDKGYDKSDPTVPDSDPNIDEELRQDELAEMKRKPTDNAGG